MQLEVEEIFPKILKVLSILGVIINTECWYWFFNTGN